MVTAEQKRILVGLLLDGVVSIAEVVRFTGLRKQAVHRWVDADVCKEARARTAVLVIEAAIDPQAKGRKVGRPTRAETNQMRIVSQKNPKKHLALRKLRRNEATVPEAAKIAGVPLSGMIAWARMAHIALPPEYENRRHREDKRRDVDALSEYANGVAEHYADALANAGEGILASTSATVR